MRVGQLSLCSQVLLLPLGVPPVPAPACGIWRGRGRGGCSCVGEIGMFAPLFTIAAGFLRSLVFQVQPGAANAAPWIVVLEVEGLRAGGGGGQKAHPLVPRQGLWAPKIPHCSDQII